MPSVRKSLLLLTLGATAFSLAACGGRARQELAYVEKPVEQLYREATRSLDRGVWDQAALEFNEVQRQHPFSVWAQRSMLMASYAQYRSRDYAEAITSSEGYLALHPGGDGAAYAYYLIGICHFEQILDVGREQSRSELALASLSEVVRRYPQSEYARDASLKVDMVRDQLAGKEMEIGRFYLREKNHLAAINRFRRVVEEYQTTSHTPEALHRLVEAYISIGLLGEAQAAAAVLGYNYPGNQWYQDSYKLLTSRDIPLIDVSNGAYPINRAHSKNAGGAQEPES